MTKARVLVVDDADSIRDHLKNIFTSDGYDVTEADRGTSGLEASQKEQFDLIVTDVNMPDMNGIDMIAKLREDSMNLSTPVMVVTTESLRRWGDTCKELGAQFWIMKPFSETAILSVAKKIIDSNQSSSAS